MQKLRSIQVLRGIAACSIVFLHSFAPPGAGQQSGHAGVAAAGVDLFFVISGFIMAHVSRGKSADEFLGERVWRIYPLWWFAMVPYLLIVPFGAGRLAASLTLWPIWGAHYDPVLGVGWTLEFEMLFYVGMATALLWRPRIPLAFYGLCLAAGFAINSPLIRFVGSPMALEFLMGVLIARAPPMRPMPLLLLVGVLCLALSPPWFSAEGIAFTPTFALMRAILWGGPCSLIVYSALSLESRVHDGLWVKLGDASYSIYLFHAIVAYGLPIHWLLKMVMAVAMGCAMHLLVEQPLLKLRRHTMAWRPKASIVAASPED